MAVAVVVLADDDAFLAPHGADEGHLVDPAADGDGAVRHDGGAVPASVVAVLEQLHGLVHGGLVGDGRAGGLRVGAEGGAALGLGICTTVVVVRGSRCSGVVLVVIVGSCHEGGGRGGRGAAIGRR